MCIRDSANVSNVARPLVSLVPKGMNGPWSRFMLNDWGMITKSIDKLNERVRYFTVAGLSEADLTYLEALIGELKEIVRAMDAPIVADGAAPGVRPVSYTHLYSVSTVSGATASPDLSSAVKAIQ